MKEEDIDLPEEFIDLHRRHFLRGIGASPLAGLALSTEVAGQSEREITVVQPETRDFTVTPLSNGEPVEDFYGYREHETHPESNTSTGIEESDVSQLFFYEHDGRLSLVVLHDAPHESGGGDVTFAFEGLPADGAWVVRDDDPGNDSYFGTDRVEWHWNPARTDGGAFRDVSGVDEITVTPQRFNGIDRWQVRSGDGSTTELNTNQSVILTVGGETPIEVKRVEGPPTTVDIDETGTFTIALNRGGISNDAIEASMSVDVNHRGELLESKEVELTPTDIGDGETKITGKFGPADQHDVPPAGISFVVGVSVTAAGEAIIIPGLEEPVTVQTNAVRASATTLQFIPGEEENPSRGGHPLNSGLMEVFPQGGSVSVDVFGHQIDLPIDPVLDSWLGGDLRNTIEPKLKDARKKTLGKYTDDAQGAFRHYRFGNGITVSFETTDDGGIIKDTIEVRFSEEAPDGNSNDDPLIAFGDEKNSKSVLHDHEINGIPWRKWYDGENVRRSNRQRRYYKIDTDFDFDGVEGVRVTTVWGGYAGFVGDLSRRVGHDTPDFFKEIWDWNDITHLIAELALIAAPGRVQFLIDYLVVVPNTYSYIDFIVLADGRRYIRVWDASQYPSLATYVDGRREAFDPLPYEPQQLLNLQMTAFHVLASAGLTPFTSALSFYERALADEKFMIKEIEEALKHLSLPPIEHTVADFIPTIPRETLAFPSGNKDREPIDNPGEPFGSYSRLFYPSSEVGEIKHE